MKTCAKCGEIIEEQCQSCWKCAADWKQPSPPTLPRPNWYNYVFALFIAYLIPWLAVLTRAVSFWRDLGEFPLIFQHLPNVLEFRPILWMLIPAGATFPFLLPF